MRVILLKNVPNLGKIGESVDTKPSFVLNYLIPHNLAALPNDKRVKEMEAERKTHQAQKGAEVEQIFKDFERLDGKTFDIPAKADKNGRLYGSIGPKDIAIRLGVSESLIGIHLKELGTFPIKVKFGENLANVKIVVKKEK